MSKFAMEYLCSSSVGVQVLHYIYMQHRAFLEIIYIIVQILPHTCTCISRTFVLPGGGMCC